jgi:ABC-type xylose transport system permease subunit
MEESGKTADATDGNLINKVQILTGAIALLFGILVYLVDRPPDQTYFVYKSTVNISFYHILPDLYGIIGNSLPSFAHIFSFILMTAGLMAFKKREFIFICLFWFLIDSVFELGQKFSTMFIKFIPDWFASIPFLENTGDYFVRGTSSFGDMAAITIGTIAAYFVLIKTRKRQQKIDHPTSNVE